ncbi:hypothetical protein LPJ63_005157 [Coemansia sp. RSA 2711]|nr:hypothetical protein LPJ63_005157 [Coemansia sp. RSA 2711]KAJ2296310.1 hypothetical protein IWW54_006979 [Coemansia sp. RSA 2705]
MSSAYVPLSLRRKIVVAIDAASLLTSTQASDEPPTPAHWQALKLVAWAKANLIRTHDDHVFLITAQDPAAWDRGVLAAMWDSLAHDRETHTSARAQLEQALDAVRARLSGANISVSSEVLAGEIGEQSVEFVRRHRGELLVVSAPERGVLAEMAAYAWSDVCVRRAGCPVVVVKPQDVGDGVVAALD